MDRDSLYRCEGLGSIAEQIAGKEPQTQFGRALKPLGVEPILANRPQAKGRGERMNGVLPDRLVKALRRAGIQDLAAANAFLAKTYWPEHNRKFRYEPASAVAAPQDVPKRLAEGLSWEEARVVQRDWTVACGGKWYQLDRQTRGAESGGEASDRADAAGWPGATGTRRGETEVERTERTTGASQSQSRRQAGEACGGKETGGESSVAKPADWKRERQPRGACLAVGDSGRPSLRSGLPASPTARHGGKRENNQPRGHFHLSS